MFEQLKNQFIGSFKDKVQQLNAALETNNFQALTVQVHQLAGSSGSYGFNEVADLCSEIEAMAQNKTTIDQQISARTQLLIQLMERHTTESL